MAFQLPLICCGKALTPMDPEFIHAFARAAEETVMLALIEPYRKNGMLDQAPALAAGLAGPIYVDFRNKLSEDIACGTT